MTLQNYVAAPIIIQLGWTLLHSLWEVAVVCGMVFCVLRAIRHAPAATRYGVALAGLLLMVVLPAGTFFAVRETASRSPQGQFVAVAAPGGGSAVAPKPNSGNARGGDMSARPSSPAARVPAAAASPVSAGTSADGEHATPASAFAAPGWKNEALCYGVVIWLAGVLLLSVWRLGGWMLLRRLRTVGTAPLQDDIHQALRRMSARLGIRRAVRVVGSMRVDVPLVLGFFKPVILFPPALLAGLSMPQVEAILAHELAHVRRHDYAALLLQTVVETVLFYHPGVWWLTRRLNLEREQCCDDLAAVASGNRRDYAAALAAVETVRFAMPALAVTGSRPSDLRQRIGRLLGIHVPVRPQRVRTAALALLAVLALLFSMSYSAKAQADDAATFKVTVSDADGKPLPGVTVRIRGEFTDTTGYTDEKGILKIPHAFKDTRGHWRAGLLGKLCAGRVYLDVQPPGTRAPQCRYNDPRKDRPHRRHRRRSGRQAARRRQGDGRPHQKVRQWFPPHQGR